MQKYIVYFVKIHKQNVFNSLIILAHFANTSLMYFKLNCKKKTEQASGFLQLLIKGAQSFFVLLKSLPRHNELVKGCLL